MANTPYTIAAGDTLSGIAAKNNTTVSELASANGITDPNKIQAGATINIPDPANAGNGASPSAIGVSGLGSGSSTAPTGAPTGSTKATNALGVTANGVTGAATGSTTGIGSGSGAGGSSTTTATGTPITDLSQVTDSASLGQYLQSLIGKQATQGQFTIDANATDNGAGSVNADTAALAAANNSALTTGKAYDDQIQSLQDNNPEGKFGGGLDQSVNDLTRLKNQDLANIGIQQQVAQNNLAAAQGIVTQKVNAQFEPLQNEITALGTLNSVYQNDMSDSEKAAASAALATKTATAKALSDAYSTALTTAVQNGAPQSILQAIDKAVNDPNATPASIDEALGNYGQNSLDVQEKEESILASKASIAASDRANQTTTNILPNGMVVTSTGTSAPNASDVKVATDAANQAATVNKLQVLYNTINNSNGTTTTSAAQIAQAKNTYNSLLSTLPKNIQSSLPTINFFSGGLFSGAKAGNAQFAPVISSLNSSISSVIPRSTPPPYGQVFSTPAEAQTYFTQTGQASQYATEVAQANALAQKLYKRNANDGEILQVINGQ